MSHARLLLLDLPDPPSLPIDRGTRVREVGRGLLPLATPIGLRPDEHAPTRADSRRLISRVLEQDRKSTRLNSSHVEISYAVFCLKKKNNNTKVQNNECIKSTNTLS